MNKITLRYFGLGAINFISSVVAQQSPNIIYILADDLGYAEIGCYGQSKIETPNIDQLAKQGMRFTQNYSGSPVSAPSRCVTFTGLHTGHSYIRGNDEMAERGAVGDYYAMYNDSTLEGQRPLPTGTITIASILKEAGYATGCIGKWGLGYPGSEGTPNKMGFDFFYGYNCQRQAHTYYPPFLYRNEAREYLPNELLPPNVMLDEGADPYNAHNYAKYTKEAYSCDLMYNEILDFVERNKKQPFFLAWTTPLPHVPLQVPDKWINYYREKFGDEEPYTGNAGYYPCRYPHATYAAMISYWDEQIGGLVAKLKELGIYKNTVIIFTSDNGPTFNGGSNSVWFNSAQPFKSERGWGKTSLHEGGIRVPLIITWEGKVKANSVSNHICASWDMMPTICEFAKIDPPKTDGISILPSLLGKKQPQHKYLYWEFPEGNGSIALRKGKWKLLITNASKAETQVELFDLEEDLQEQNNLTNNYPDIVEEFKQYIIESHISSELERFKIKYLCD